jgi:signal transduction histidine kinase
LKANPPQDIRVLVRGHCQRAGYESVALIPLRSGDEIVGLFQLSDSCPERFTPKMIRFFEGIGASLGIALARISAEERAENLAKFPSESPFPVLRISKDGTLLYANASGMSLLSQWNCQVGACAPENWRMLIAKVLDANHNGVMEVQHNGSTLSFVIAPVVEAGYVNVYGYDVTEHRKAEQEILRLNEELEQRVVERTAKLTRAHKLLIKEVEERKCLEKELLGVSEREKRLIGQELHDSLGQQLTGVALMAKILERKLAGLPDEAADAAEITKLVNLAMNQAHGLARGLHPVGLDAAHLKSALKELTATSEQLFGIICCFRAHKRVVIDDAAMAIHIYRIAQEAITNAIKHGAAKNIRVSLAYGKSNSVLTVESDGLDFPEGQVGGNGMGLKIMEHRAEMIGSSLDVRKNINGGTIVTCVFPNKKH